MWLLIAGYIWLQQSSSSASKLISSSSFFSQNFKTFNSIIWYHQALLPVSPYFNNTCLSLWRSKMMMWHYTRIKFKKKKNGQMRKCCHSVHTRVLFFFKAEVKRSSVVPLSCFWEREAVQQEVRLEVAETHRKWSEARLSYIFDIDFQHWMFK